MMISVARVSRGVLGSVTVEHAGVDVAIVRIPNKGGGGLGESRDCIPREHLRRRQPK